ncbi:MAG: histidine kinase [Rikenellaceae bacterium]
MFDGAKRSRIIGSILAALIISLTINLTGLIYLFAENHNIVEIEKLILSNEIKEGVYDGTYYRDPLGHGIVVTQAQDTIYVPYFRVRRFAASEGDQLRVMASYAKDRSSQYLILSKALSRNGVNIAYEIFSPLNKYLETALQLVYYFALTLLLITLTTHTARNTLGQIIVSLLAIIIAICLYPLCPCIAGRYGDFIFAINSTQPFSDILIIKWLFAVGASLLYSWIYLIFSRQQTIILENEQLKIDNITTRYNLLMSQVNPHFFFNSLNSLSMLVREGDQKRGLTYIDQLSYTFRYNIQNGEGHMTTLAEEMRFAEAYIYLFKIRYEDKLFFDINIEDSMLEWLLPAMSLQPLLDNAVKHNTITKAQPLKITIKTNGDILTVENPKRPKLDKEPSTGIGLDNLRKRWLLSTGKEISIEDKADRFAVTMQLTKPNES